MVRNFETTKIFTLFSNLVRRRRRILYLIRNHRLQTIRKGQELFVNFYHTGDPGDAHQWTLKLYPFQVPFNKMVLLYHLSFLFLVTGIDHCALLYRHGFHDSRLTIFHLALFRSLLWT